MENTLVSQKQEKEEEHFGRSVLHANTPSTVPVPSFSSLMSMVSTLPVNTFDELDLPLLQYNATFMGTTKDFLEEERASKRAKNRQEVLVQQYFTQMDIFLFKFASECRREIQLNPLPLFEILEEPHAHQRKSFANELRYFIPKPIEVLMRAPRYAEELPPVDGGNVFVEIVSKDGAPIPRSGEMLHADDDKLNRPLDKFNTARFNLWMSETSTGLGGYVCLLFTINYTTRGETREERVMSQPFKVDTNCHTPVDKKPVIMSVTPNFGVFHRETEVWIHGYNFAPAVQIYFGSKLGVTKEVNSNLIVVIVPPRNDLIVNGTKLVHVRIELSNKTPIVQAAARQPVFTYIFPP